MDKTLYLCFSCAALMADGYSLTELPEPLKNSKCARCGRKVWGATYKITKKITAAPLLTGCAAVRSQIHEDLCLKDNTDPPKIQA